MSLPDFRDQIQVVASRVKAYSQWTKSENVRLADLRKKDDKLKKSNFDKARSIALEKLDQIKLIAAMSAVEDVVLDIYGKPSGQYPAAHWQDRIWGRLFPFSTRTENIGDPSEVKVLVRQIDAGKVAPELEDKRKYTTLRVPEISIVAACKYSPSGIALAIGEGRYGGLTREGHALYNDPRFLRQQRIIPFKPIEDWSGSRVQGELSAIFKGRPELAKYIP